MSRLFSIFRQFDVFATTRARHGTSGPAGVLRLMSGGRRKLMSGGNYTLMGT